MTDDRPDQAPDGTADPDSGRVPASPTTPGTGDDAPAGTGPAVGPAGGEDSSATAEDRALPVDAGEAGGAPGEADDEVVPTGAGTARAGAAAAPDPATARPARIRRAPRYGSFVFSGGVIGLAVAIIAGVIRDGDGGLGRIALVITSMLVFGLAGAVLAVVVDRRSQRP